MKSYTDLEQSKKLTEILPLESADMYYPNRIGMDNYPLPIEWKNGLPLLSQEIPCWSLAALMDVLDRGALFKTPQGWVCQSYTDFEAIISDYYDNPVDACYEMVLKLHELKLL